MSEQTICDKETEIHYFIVKWKVVAQLFGFAVVFDKETKNGNLFHRTVHSRHGSKDRAERIRLGLEGTLNTFPNMSNWVTGDKIASVRVLDAYQKEFIGIVEEFDTELYKPMLFVYDSSYHKFYFQVHNWKELNSVAFKILKDTHDLGNFKHFKYAILNLKAPDFNEYEITKMPVSLQEKATEMLNSYNKAKNDLVLKSSRYSELEKCVVNNNVDESFDLLKRIGSTFNISWDITQFDTIAIK